MKYIGKQIPKVDGIQLVKGAPVYTDDLAINNNALVVKILRSPHAHARIKNIEIEDALALAGVECVLTYKDVSQKPFTLAGQSFPEPSPYDRRILEKTVRYVGDEVAIVAAVNERIALKSLKLIKVEYEVLEAVLNLEEAIDNPILVHEGDVHVNFDIGHDSKRNIAASQKLEFGDVEAEFAKSDVVVERTYKTQAQAHAMMETYRASSSYDANGRLQVMSSTQIPFHVRRHLSRILDIPKSKIKVIKPRLGGGFGGKQTAQMEFLPALVTVKTGKPATLIYTRGETFASSTSRHAMQLNVRLGADKEGKLNCVDIHCLSDTGAYGEHAPTVFWVVGQKTLPLYGKAKACRYHGHAVYTNKSLGGALRGYGATQGTFALESAMNELAEKLGMDPTELRLKNLTEQDQSHPALCGSLPEKPKKLDSSTLHKCITKGKELIGWEENYPFQDVSEEKKIGYGMAVTMQGSGIAGIDTASVFIKLNEDGFFTLSHGASDMGQGSDTVLTQIAAEVLEVDLSKVIINSYDLDTMPYDPGAYASSGAYVTGNATIRAAEDMKNQLIAAGKEYLKSEDVEYEEGILKSDNGSSVTIGELASHLCSFAGKDQLVGKGTFGGDTSPPPFIAGFAKVEVDIETGTCKVLDYVAVVDCGTVLNENLARIQVEGGVVMGVGMGLYEEVRYTAKGRLSTNSFMEYKIPVREDIYNIQVAFEESNEPTGPFGAKSIGEVVCNTPPPAIAHAIYNATGYRCTELPVTAEKILLNTMKVND